MKTRFQAPTCVFIALARSGAGLLPSLSIIWPRYLIFSIKNPSFPHLAWIPSPRFSWTSYMYALYCSALWLFMKMSSRYAIASSSPLSTVVMTYWKMVGVTLIQNDNRSKLNKPRLGCLYIAASSTPRPQLFWDRHHSKKKFPLLSFTKISFGLGKG